VSAVRRYGPDGRPEWVKDDDGRPANAAFSVGGTTDYAQKPKAGVDPVGSAKRIARRRAQRAREATLPTCGQWMVKSKGYCGRAMGHAWNHATAERMAINAAAQRKAA
jgi:hypothetical protein